MIKAGNIFKSFGDQDVLKDVSFTFEAGKTNLIIGKSGAGKTVFLKAYSLLVLERFGMMTLTCAVSTRTRSEPYACR